jgi:hypothetical protein
MQSRLLALFSEYLKAEPHQWGLLSPLLNLFYSSKFPTNIENITSRTVTIPNSFSYVVLILNVGIKWQDNFLVCELCNCMLSPEDCSVGDEGI